MNAPQNRGVIVVTDQYLHPLWLMRRAAKFRVG